MNVILKAALALLAALLAAHAGAQVTFYERDNFEGQALTTLKSVDDFVRAGFNDRSSSVVVTGSAWEVCEHAGFRGQCIVLRPGHYRSLREMRMNNRLSSARPVGRHGRRDENHYAPPPLPGQIVFYEHDGFDGRAFKTEQEVVNFQRFGFNDRASSVVVLGERWEACEHVGFAGRCVILRPGRYPNLGAMGLNDRVSSVRIVHPEGRFDEDRYAPPPAPVYDWRRRPRERIYQVNVASVRAVFAAPQQRCWIERERVVQEQRGSPNAGGALIGGIVGGIIGHQAGGPNRDAATVGGAVVGAAIGSQVGRNSGGQTTTVQDVQRCESVPTHGRPEYWDVTYYFRGIEHHVQTTSPPGPTLSVNEQGEPRM